MYYQIIISFLNFHVSVFNVVILFSLDLLTHKFSVICFQYYFLFYIINAMNSKLVVNRFIPSLFF